jgi:hypothetical protein
LWPDFHLGSGRPHGRGTAQKFAKIIQPSRESAASRRQTDLRLHPARRLRIGEGGDKDSSQLPPKFILAISKSGNVFRRCDLVWHNKNEIGVRFAGVA